MVGVDTKNKRRGGKLCPFPSISRGRRIGGRGCCPKGFPPRVYPPPAGVVSRRKKRGQRQDYDDESFLPSSPGLTQGQEMT